MMKYWKFHIYSNCRQNILLYIWNKCLSKVVAFIMLDMLLISQIHFPFLIFLPNFSSPAHFFIHMTSTLYFSSSGFKTSMTSSSTLLFPLFQFHDLVYSYTSLYESTNYILLCEQKCVFPILFILSPDNNSKKGQQRINNN